MNTQSSIITAANYESFYWYAGTCFF